MGRTPIPSKHTLKMREEHEKVKKQLKNLEKKYLKKPNASSS